MKRMAHLSAFGGSTAYVQTYSFCNDTDEAMRLFPCALPGPVHLSGRPNLAIQPPCQHLRKMYANRVKIGDRHCESLMVFFAKP